MKINLTKNSIGSLPEYGHTLSQYLLPPVSVYIRLHVPVKRRSSDVLR